MFIRSQRFLSNNTHSNLLPVLKRKGSYLILALFSVVFFIFFTPLVQAVQCSAVFTDGLQNNKNGGEIAFKNGSQLKNSPNNILDSKKNIDDGSGNNVNSCDSGNCINSGSKAERVNYNNFPNGNDVEVSYQQTISLAPGGYNEFKVASEATVKLSAGDYTFKDDFILGSSSKIEIVGTGVVRIFVKKKVTTNNKTKINLNGNATKLLLYARDDIEIGTESEISAFIYSDKKVSLKNKAFVEGAISAGNDVDLISASTVSFVNIEPDFGGFCGSESLPVPILDYRFDDCSYTGSTNEVFDQQEDFHGRAIGVPDPIADAVVNQSMDLSANGTSDWVQVPNDAIDGLNDFTIAVWIKTSVSKSQQEIFHALGGSTGDDELEIYLIDADEVRVKVRDEGDELELNNGVNLTDGNWHHLVITRKGEDVCLFVDGEEQECDDGVNNGALDVPELNAIVIGQEQDAYGGGFNASQSFEGKLDEFKIYDTKLTSTNIKTIYDNELAGKNYDGTVRTAPQCNSLIANFRFDESSWSGAAGEIIDTAGNFNAQAKNGANTARTNPARIGNPGTCGYGVFDGVDDYVEIADNNALDLPNELTISTWIYPQSIPSSGLMAILSKDENYEFHVTPAGEINWWWSTNQFSTSGAAIRANNWYHIAITYKNGQQRIYVDGEILASQAYTGQLAVNNDALQIGQDQFFSGRYFHGAIDEVQLYNQALTNAQVNELYLATHPCDSFVDHFEINMLDGQGLTCEADIIKLRVCSDASCSVLNPDAIDAVLSVADSGGNTLTKNVTVVGGELDVQYIHTQAGAVSLSLNQAFECINGSPTLCDVTFADTGFRFYATTEGTPIPEQLSGKPSNVGFLASTLKVQAIEKNADTGACQAALIDTPAIEMAASCVDPIACAGNQVVINNLITTTNIPTLNNGAALTYSPVALDFADDTQNSAAFALTYADAGKIQLHARYNIPDDNGDPSGNYMFGSSNNFVVRPFGFYVNVIDNPKAQTATQINSVFKKAGDDFTTHLSAVQWQAADDTNNDGVPDSGANLANNPPTINFGNEITPEKAIINDSLYLPAAGKEGDLVNDSFTHFVNGVATNNNMTYSEVGIVNFAANLTDNSYLGAGDVTGSEPYVGRFIPHHFELTIALDGELKSVCDITEPSSVMDFAYIGQLSKASPSKGALQYLLKPEVTITPQTKFNSHTENYTGDFTKLLLSGVKRFEIDDGTGTLVLAPVEDRVKRGADEVNKVKLKANLAEGNLTKVAGVLSFQYSSADNFIYTHEQNAEVSPFTSIIHLSLVSVIDEDGVTANDADGLGDTGIATDTVITLKPTGRQIRFGRAYLDNSFGPETSRLPQPFAVQYLNTAGKFVINTEDTCTNFNTDNITLTSGTLDESFTSVIAANGQFDDELPNGKTRAMLLEITGSGNQGTVNVEYDIYSWLKYDWDWDGVSAKEFTDNPSAIATFGMYRGNDRIIYQRERERSN